MSLLDIFLGETLGTMFLILLGNGVVANVLCKKTGGSKGGIITIAFGWALAVFMGVIIANAFGTGGHLNPAVTIASWVGGSLPTGQAFVYFASELFGAMIGQTLVVIFYWKHLQEAENKEYLLSVHSTGPTHKDAVFHNVFSEFIGTAVLVSIATVLSLSFLTSTSPAMAEIMRFAGPLSVALVVLGIGVSLGGTTGYAINPARDLGPRIVYQLTPYKNKGSANWKYSWVPIAAPLSAGVLVGAFSRLIV